MATPTQNPTQSYPDDFRCPISLEVMSDPVILSSGHTFDRGSIQRWLDAGNRTCPVTKQPVPRGFRLIPNHALRSLISRSWVSEFDRIREPQSLVCSLMAKESTLEVKVDCLRQMEKQARKDSGFRMRLTECGAVPEILRCFETEEVELRELALTVLLSLSLDDHNKVGLVAEGAVEKVVGALRGGGSCRALAATMLTSLAMVEVNKGTIGAYPNAIALLIALLRSGKARERKEAATALYVLCSFGVNRRIAVESGAVGASVEAAEFGIERAVEVLGLLAKCDVGRVEMVRSDTSDSSYRCVNVLVRFLRSESERSVVHALSALNALCGFEEMRLEVVKMGGLEICLGLANDENEKISKNATALVRTLGWRRLKE